MKSLPLLDAAEEVSPDAADAAERNLLTALAGLGSVLVAWSGGVDSTYLAWAARRALGRRALAVTGVSASLPSAQAGQLEGLARDLGLLHERIATGELDNPRYRANAPDRCYWCKDELYDRLEVLRRERGLAAVVDGTNRDDLGEVRPGRRAAAEHGVRSPLVEAGLGKAAIRLLSRRAGLPTWHQPASPCLASRIPHGQAIEPKMLALVDRAEAAVRALGFREFRVRHLGERARIEVSLAELERARGDDRLALLAAVRDAGFPAAELDPEPLRSGRLSAIPHSGGTPR